MKPFLLLSVAILAGGCTAREDSAIPQNQALPKGPPMFTHSIGPEVPADCALRVEFGSYAMGIDRTASAAVDRLLADDPGVTSVQTVPQGREGEKTVCVAVRSDADAERLFQAISRTFPADPRGPLAVVTRGGRRFSAGR
jgi:hypothetical protein